MQNVRKFDTDVLVVGGGVAGVSAALTAARSGLRTLLIENQISLGGLATNGYVTGIAGMIEGNCKEWLDRLNTEGSLFNKPHTPSIDPEKGKFVLESMLLEAGARILYGTYATDAIVENDCIKGVIGYSKSGRMEIGARIVIDATGDADIAAAAGAPYEVGSTQFSGLNMSTTLGFRMANVNMRQYRTAMQQWMEKQTIAHSVPAKMNLYTELHEKAVQNGDLPFPISNVALIYPIPGTSDEASDITFMSTHSFYTHNTDVEDLTRQIIEQHQQMLMLEKFLKKYVPGFENSRITGMGNIHGVRDSRRIVGEYILKDEDVACGVKFEDGIAKFPEFFDTHHPTNVKAGFIRHVHLKEPKANAICRPAECSYGMHPLVKPGGYEARVNPLEYCEIPYRCLIPLKIDNLFVAGRCMSAEFNAIAAVRVIATSMSTGQAAGIASAICLKDGITPRKLDGKVVRATLIKQGVPLDEEPGGHWSNVKKELQGEFVVLPGDFIGVRTANGIKTHM
jgi:hypothetical protein